MSLDKRLLASLLPAALLACGARPPVALPDPRLLAPEKVADLPGYTEGIAFDARGTAYVSSGRHPDRPHAVYRLPPGAPAERWLGLRFPNGHKVLADGSHVVAGEGAIVHAAADGRVLDSLTRDAEGVPFRRPNDIALDGHAGLYVTDPGATGVAGEGKLLYLDSTWVAKPVRGGFCYPNGLVVRADGQALYLADSCDGRIYLLPILGPGRVGEPRVLATVPDSTDAGVDGMTLDAAGRLYVAHNGVARIEVFDSAGHPLASYPAGNALASNVAFGGPGLEDLYVTGSPEEKAGPGALYRLRLGVRGRSSMAVPAP